ncbi:hypothetical protein BKP37_15885 [Anaerobacillus alkalilacustris]|uniref:Thioredoxin-like fold domain-containing protein n=1 Tax=Anaerobacillus alkalilacustris TaxID=393763 RepID=A0A1S2LIQ2_9BACI|nr:hypothetical protein [Anaerobacillus alkalilacustris]OIJ11355.1 hypothetical protein BKP37_15885 [Anaerobacillus alkalilacustris]
MKLINEGFQAGIEVSCLSEVIEIVSSEARQYQITEIPTFLSFKKKDYHLLSSDNLSSYIG